MSSRTGGRRANGPVQPQGRVAHPMNAAHPPEHSGAAIPPRVRGRSHHFNFAAIHEADQRTYFRAAPGVRHISRLRPADSHAAAAAARGPAGCPRRRAPHDPAGGRRAASRHHPGRGHRAPRSLRHSRRVEPGGLDSRGRRRDARGRHLPRGGAAARALLPARLAHRPRHHQVGRDRHRPGATTAEAPAVRLAASAVQLEGITATGERSAVQMSADRNTYSTKDMPTAAGATPPTCCATCRRWRWTRTAA
jgi:hypothetical protein